MSGIFAHCYQNGNSGVDIFSPSGTSPAKHFKLTAAVKKEYDRFVKGSVYVMEKASHSTLIQCPPNYPCDSMGITQPYLVMQLQSREEDVFSVEIVILDERRQRRRLHFSTTFARRAENTASHGTATTSRHISRASTFHAQIFWAQSTRECWTNVVFCLSELTTHYFPGASYTSLDSICIHPVCRIRKIFSLPASCVYPPAGSRRSPIVDDISVSGAAVARGNKNKSAQSHKQPDPSPLTNITGSVGQLYIPSEFNFPPGYTSCLHIVTNPPLHPPPVPGVPTPAVSHSNNTRATRGTAASGKVKDPRDGKGSAGASGVKEKTTECVTINAATSEPTPNSDIFTADKRSALPAPASSVVGAKEQAPASSPHEAENVVFPPSLLILTKLDEEADGDGSAADETALLDGDLRKKSSAPPARSPAAPTSHHATPAHVKAALSLLNTHTRSANATPTHTRTAEKAHEKDTVVVSPEEDTVIAAALSHSSPGSPSTDPTHLSHSSPLDSPLRGSTDTTHLSHHYFGPQNMSHMAASMTAPTFHRYDDITATQVVSPVGASRDCNASDKTGLCHPESGNGHSAEQQNSVGSRSSASWRNVDAGRSIGGCGIVHHQSAYANNPRTQLLAMATTQLRRAEEDFYLEYHQRVD